MRHREAKYEVYHDIDLKEESVYVPITWRYYPGWPQTYTDPEAPPEVEFVSVDVPDELEHRREEVEWKIEDGMGELQEEALEEIHGIFERQRNGGHEYD